MLVVFTAFCLFLSVSAHGSSLRCVKIDNVQFQRQYFYDIVWTNLPHGADNSAFWKHVDNKQLSKNDIATELYEFCRRSGGVLASLVFDKFNNHLNAQSQNYRSIIIKSDLSPAAKNFAILLWNRIYDLGTSWEETCKKNNEALLHQKQDTIDELRESEVSEFLPVYLNSNCMSSSEVRNHRNRFEKCSH